MDFYPFRFDVTRLRPLLQRDLYTNPDVVLRELTQNACDAIVRRAQTDKSFDPERDGEVVFEFNKLTGALTVSDNGAGMSREQILEVFRYYGRSDKGSNEIGAFGLGAKSVFAAADSFTIDTNSMETKETLQVYATLQGLSFQPVSTPRRSFGTTMTIPIQAFDSNHSSRDYVFLARTPNNGDPDQKRKTDLSYLRCYCRCVRVPVYIKHGEQKELVSRKDFWSDDEDARIQADGFEIYLNDRAENTNKFLVEGIFVCEVDSPEQVPYHSYPGFAVNITRKDLVNLTMSRDNIIRDEKYNALLRAVVPTIVKHVGKSDFNDREVLLDKRNRNLVKWLSQHSRGDGTRVWRMLSRNIQRTVNMLTIYIRVCRENSCVSLRPIDLFDLAQPKHYLLGERKDRIERIAKEKGIAIVYNSCSINRAELTAWLERFGVKPLTKPRVRTQEYTIVAVSEMERFSTFASLEVHCNRTYSDGSKTPLFIFPRQGLPLNRVRQAAHNFGIHAVRLEDGREIRGNSVDLRKPLTNSRAVWSGQTEDAEETPLSSARLVPPEFFAFASMDKTRNFIFPQDMTAACRLAIRGFRFAACDGLVQILKHAVPYRLHAWMSWNTLRTVEHCREVAQIGSTIGVDHPHLPWLFVLATSRPFWAKEMSKKITKP